MARQLFIDLHSKLGALNEDILSLDRRISAQVRLSEPMQRAHEILGVDAITASAVVATVGNAIDFKNGRPFAAWLGLVPKQYSTGGKTMLGRITNIAMAAKNARIIWAVLARGEAYRPDHIVTMP
jgi:transposase